MHRRFYFGHFTAHSCSFATFAFMESVLFSADLALGCYYDGNKTWKLLLKIYLLEGSSNTLIFHISQAAL